MSIEDWTDKDYALAALDMLPDDVDEIAGFLRRQGIKSGTAGNCCTCPIALFLAKWVGCAVAVGVVSTWGIYYTAWRFDIPPAVISFIHEFDNHEITL